MFAYHFNGKCICSPQKTEYTSKYFPQSIPSAILRECAIELCYVLSHLLNSSFESGVVPDSWKQGYIAVIPKVNPVKSTNDLRPIAVTSNIAKIAEFFIHKELMISITPHLSKLQFGVLPKKSTNHYLIRMLDFLLKSLDKKSTPAILTLLDCQKAFDMVDHNLIISRLIEIEVNGYVINWVTNFLSNRSNCVRIGKLMSSFQIALQYTLQIVNQNYFKPNMSFNVVRPSRK